MFNELILADALASDSNCVGVWIFCVALGITIIGLITYIVHISINHRLSVSECKFLQLRLTAITLQLAKVEELRKLIKDAEEGVPNERIETSGTTSRWHIP